MRYKLPLFVLIAGILIIPSLGRSQGPGGGMLKMAAGDPDAAFNFLSGGKDVIVVSELSPKQQGMLRMVAGKLGKELGEKITRDEWKSSASAIQTGRKSGTMPPLRDIVKTATGTHEAAPPSGGPPTSKGLTERRDAIIENYFRRMDKNSDGVLSTDEIPEDLQLEKVKYDANMDGFIDLSEFKTFTAVVRPPRGDQEKGKDSPETTTPDQKPALEDPRPTVFRAGKLPKGLPEWFVRLDKAGDCDGQVGLWEARNDKSVMDGFAKMDLNGDGLLTAEELLRYQASQKKKTEDPQVAAANNGDVEVSGDVQSAPNGSRTMNFRFNGNFPAGGFPPTGGMKGNSGTQPQTTFPATGSQAPTTGFTPKWGSGAPSGSAGSADPNAPAGEGFRRFGRGNRGGGGRPKN